MSSLFGDIFGNPCDRLAVVSAVGQACHQVCDEPCLFHDDVAARLVGLSPAVLALFLGEDGGFRSGRFYMAGRARFVTERIAAAVAAGTRQLVVYSAGMTTFCYQDVCREMRSFEIDNPQFQAWKRSRLADSGISPPASLRYIPADGPPAAGQLEASGFDPREPTMFIWLGTLPLTDCDRISHVLDHFSEYHLTDLIMEYLEPRTETITQSVVSLALAPMTAFPIGKIAAGFEASGFRTSADLTVPELIARYTTTQFDGPIFLPLHLLHLTRDPR